eukprot:15070974-Heterocapsa_arctica.AAC.1
MPVLFLARLTKSWRVPSKVHWQAWPKPATALRTRSEKTGWLALNAGDTHTARFMCSAGLWTMLAPRPPRNRKPSSATRPPRRATDKAVSGPSAAGSATRNSVAVSLSVTMVIRCLLAISLTEAIVVGLIASTTHLSRNIFRPLKSGGARSPSPNACTRRASAASRVLRFDAARAVRSDASASSSTLISLGSNSPLPTPSSFRAKTLARWNSSSFV